MDILVRLSPLLKMTESMVVPFDGTMSATLIPPSCRTVLDKLALKKICRSASFEGEQLGVEEKENTMIGLVGLLFSPECARCP
jgi:hypothetical protein